MRIFMSVFLSAALFFPASWASAQIITHEQLQKLDKSNLGGGEGTVNAAFAFTRDNATSGQVIKEIGWLTLKPGTSVGYHKHVDNEDAYIIVSGHGLFKDSDGKTYPVKKGDVTIARKGESHGLSNNGSEPLVFISVIAAQN